MSGIKVLVCGGRDFQDRPLLWSVLSDIHQARKIAAVIHGAARGADKMAGDFAAERGIAVREYPANWTRDGRIAGPLRNSRMLEAEAPDLVVAFPGGRGTADMVIKARRSGVEVMHVAPETSAQHS